MKYPNRTVEYKQLRMRFAGVVARRRTEPVEVVESLRAESFGA